MSFLLIDVAILGGGFMLGRWLVRRSRARRMIGGGAGDSPATRPRGAPALAPDPFGGLPFKLGDVLLRRGLGDEACDEAWLAGALVFSEERPVAALFIAPEAGGDRAIWVCHGVGEGAHRGSGFAVSWLTPLGKGGPPALALAGEPPHSLEHDGVRFERARRLPLTVTRHGSGAPAVGAQAVVAEYTGGGDQRLLVVAGETTLAFVGLALRDQDYEVLPGDASTLER